MTGLGYSHEPYLRADSTEVSTTSRSFRWFVGRRAKNKGLAPWTPAEDSNRWTAVEDELRTMLNGVAGANLIRRQRVELIAARAYCIGTQLARDPAHAVLVPHAEGVSVMGGRETGRAPSAPGRFAFDLDPKRYSHRE